MTAVWIVAAALAVANVLSFALMAFDKRRARTGQWRVPERTLFLAAACFGALGGVLGMLLCATRRSTGISGSFSRFFWQYRPYS